MRPDDHLPILRAIDRREKIPTDEFRRLLGEAGLDGRQIGDLIARLDSRDYGDYAPLRDLMRLLDCYGLAGYCEFDPGIVRGLAYYTSTVYEFWDTRRELRAIAGGGRYDDLTVALGGERLPGVGVGMGDVVLTLLLKREGKLPSLPRRLDVFVACYSDRKHDAAIRVAQELRMAGLRVERALKVTSLSSQFRQAETVGASTAVILAPDELARGEAVARDLHPGAQSAVPLEAVENAIRAMLARPGQTASLPPLDGV